MRRFNAVEKGALLLACVFIIIGAYSTIYPAEMRVPHPGSGRYQPLIGQDPPAEHVSREKARLYGIISIAFGIGIGCLVFYHPRKGVSQVSVNDNARVSALTRGHDCSKSPTRRVGSR